MLAMDVLPEMIPFPVQDPISLFIELKFLVQKM